MTLEVRDTLPPADRATRLALAAVLVVAALVYLPAVDGPFVYDDRIEVVGNPTLRDLGSPVAILTYNPGRALVILSFAIDWALWGLAPRGYHVTNVLLHLVNTWLLWRLARRVLPDTRAMLTAALWAWHPMATESVAYVAGRSDTLCAAGVLVSLEAWLAGKAPRALAAGVVAGLCKEVAFGLPLVLAGVELLRGRGLPRRMLMVAGSVAATAVVARAFLQGLPSPEVERGALAHLGGQGAAWALYLRLWLLPVGQSVFHDLDATPVGAVGFLAVGAFVGLAGRRGAVAKLGCTLFVAMLLPSSLLPVREVAAEHRALLAGAGLVFVVGTCWPERLLTGRGRVVTLGVLATLAAATTLRAATWRDEVALWRDAAGKNASSAQAHYALGDALRLAGRTREAGEVYTRVLELQPHHGDARLNLGIVLAEQGEAERARGLWLEVLREDPKACAAHNNLGALALRSGELESAIAAWQASLRACPDDLLAHLNLGQLHARLGDAPKAAWHLGQFLDHAPGGHPQVAAARGALARLRGQSALSGGRAAPP